MKTPKNMLKRPTFGPFDPKPKYKKGDRVVANGKRGTIASGPRVVDDTGHLSGCWFCHEEDCDGDCRGQLFGDRCENKPCHYCDWAKREHHYSAKKAELN